MPKKINKFYPLSALALVFTFALLRIVLYYNHFIGREVYLAYDEAIYAILSERFLAGNFMSAFHPYWNPGFPLATIPFYLLTRQWEDAQILVSMFAHVLLILASYLTIKNISRPLAVLGSFLIAFSPALEKLTLWWGVTEPLYVLLFWLALSFGLSACTKRKIIYWVLAGLFFGLAYFTRTEAIYTVGTFLIFAIVFFFVRRRKGLVVLNKTSLFAIAAATLSYAYSLYFSLGQMIRYKLFSWFYFKPSASSLNLSLIFVAIAILGFIFKRNTRKLTEIVREAVPRVGLFLLVFFLVNLPYIIAISTQLGKPTLSGKYAYIGSGHPFTPENRRLTTWAQEIWSIDYPNHRSEYYESDEAIKKLWRGLDTILEFLWRKVRTNVSFYGYDNIFTNNDVKFMLLGFLAAMLHKKFRLYAFYLFVLWAGSLTAVAFWMDPSFRYLGFSFPILLVSYAFCILAIGNLVSHTIYRLKLRGLLALGFFVRASAERKSAEAKLLRFIRGLKTPGFREGGLKITKSAKPGFIVFLTISLFCAIFFTLRVDRNAFSRQEKAGRYSDQKEIGEWLFSQGINLVMARTEGIGFYAKAKMVYVPAANPDTIVAFAKGWGVEYIVSRPAESSWEYMRAIVDPKFKHPDLKLAHSFHDGTLIWKVILTPEEKEVNYRTTRKLGY